MKTNRYGHITVMMNGKWESMSAFKFNEGVKTLERVVRGCHTRPPREGYCHAIAYRSSNPQCKPALVIIKK